MSGLSGRTLFEKRVSPEPLSEKLKPLFIIFPRESVFARGRLFVKRRPLALPREKLTNSFIIYFREIFKGNPVFVKGGFPLILSRET